MQCLYMTGTSAKHGVLHVSKQACAWQNIGLELCKLHKGHAEQLILCEAPSHVQTGVGQSLQMPCCPVMLPN